MSNPVAIGELLTPGIRAEFAFAYQPKYQGVQARLRDVVWFDNTSDGLYEIYGIPNSVPYPRLWESGNQIPSKNFTGSAFTVYNRDFGLRIYLPRNWEDDRTKSVFALARMLGDRWSTLPERIFYQIIQASTDPALLPAIPNSVDGFALYSASHAFASNGNIESQTGSTTVQDVITDFFDVQARFISMTDTEGQPYWDASETNSLSLFYSSTLTLVMTQAAKQMVTFYKDEGISAADNSVAAGVTNTIIASGTNVTWTPSQRITDDSIYTFLKGVDSSRRPMFRQVRKGMNEAQGNWDTSDHTRGVGEPYIQFDSREGWGVPLALATVKTT